MSGHGEGLPGANLDGSDIASYVGKPRQQSVGSLDDCSTNNHVDLVLTGIRWGASVQECDPTRK
ncbi:MAG: hypothetical protein ABJH68_03800 [Ilumatobacter sp.]|uniref:hypothetical protein n=1 Tax=Ilumatobacter sp. TaxID=1967498 RepID=UPI0032980752